MRGAVVDVPSAIAKHDEREYLDRCRKQDAWSSARPGYEFMAIAPGCGWRRRAMAVVHSGNVALERPRGPIRGPNYTQAGPARRNSSRAITGETHPANPHPCRWGWSSQRASRARFPGTARSTVE